MSQEKKVIVAIDRPFQLISAICLLAENAINHTGRCDLLIDPKFENAEDIANKVKSSGLFANVYISTDSTSRPQDVGKQLLKTCVGYNLNELTAWVNRSFPKLKSEDRYDILICGSINALTYTVKYMYVNSGYTIMVDEGLGSHDGTVFRTFSCLDNVFNSALVYGRNWAERLAKRLILFRSRGKLRMDIRELWLFSVGRRERALYSNISVNDLSIDGARHLLEEIFLSQQDRDVYRQSAVLYLTTSGSVSKTIKDREYELLRNIESNTEKMSIRLHPSRSEEDFTECVSPLIGSQTNWEMAFLAGWLDDKSVLIGIGSSAQFTPKKIFGVEPTLIFLYKLFPADKTISVSGMGESIIDLEKQYTHKDRIFVPSSEDELIKALRYIGNRNAENQTAE